MIIEKKTDVIVGFGDLRPGDVFCYNNMFFMKIAEGYGDGVDAIDLEDGEISEFLPIERVIKVNTKLVIE